MYPDLTYSFYPVWCSLFGIKYKTYPVDDNFRINPEDYKEQNGGVVIPNPNAPTSLGEGLDFVEKYLIIIMTVLLLLTKHMLISAAHQVFRLLRNMKICL